MGANFKYYFLPDDVNYGNLCLQKRDEMAVPIEDLVKQDDPRTMRWINGKYNYRNPSFISSKDSLLNGNVFKRVDRSPQTLDFLTSLIRKLPGTGEFEVKCFSFGVSSIKENARLEKIDFRFFCQMTILF